MKNNSTVKPSKIKKSNISTVLFIYLGIAWACLHFLVFWFGMNIGTVYNSFFTTDLAGNPRVATDGKPLAKDAAARPDLGCYENQDVRMGMCLIIH